MDEQIISAIQIAWDPTADQNLKRQAFEYVNQLRHVPTAWQPCLSIFTHIPRHAEVVRVFSLEIVNNAVQGGIVDAQGLQMVKERLMVYLSEAYRPETNDAAPDTATIENKLAQTITFLFTAFYAQGWQTCITDLLELTKTQGGEKSSLLGTAFYLRVLNAIHDEVGDQLLSRSRPEQDRANVLKDLIRDRDVQTVVLSWQEILGQLATQHPVIAELCFRAVGRWVSWIDISLVVNETMLQLLFRHLQIAQRTDLRENELMARNAVIDVFTEIIAKKMPAADKVNMISFLNLEGVISQLESAPPLAAQRSSEYDAELAETVARLVNATVADLVKALEGENSSSDTWNKAERALQGFLPHLLRFFSDEYDEVCSNVLPAMTDVLAFLRRAMQGEQFATQRAVMLTPILNAIFVKMRYDDTATWGDEDERTDEAEFQDLRKRLSALQQAIAATDEQLYMDAVAGLVMDTFEKLQSNSAQVNWRDLELALHEMYLLGELAVKSGGLYQKAKPNSPAAERLVRMMHMMVEANTGSFAHPAVQVQFMEICVRYSSFFDRHLDFIRGTLENFLKLAHHNNVKVKFRSWYLLQRFTKHQKGNVGGAAELVVSSLQDLLVVKAEVPTEDDEDDMSSENESSADSSFTSQLYLFEAVGNILSPAAIPAEKQVQLLQAVMQPLFADIETSINAASAGNEQAILQIHHEIMALGNIARGYYDWPGNNPSSSGLDAPDQVKTAFTQVSEVTLVALAALKSSFEIRTAARFAFSRLIGMVGQQMMQQLPRWVDGLLTESSSRDEMAQFLRLLDQVTFGFKNDIFGFLDSLFTGLLQRVFAGIQASTSGTDDEIELAELKREYLNFLLVILGNDLGGILVSTVNQPMFETVISTIEHFAKDIEDFPTGKMAFQLLSRMSAVWGGADIVPFAPSQNTGVTPTTGTAESALPGFNSFMIQRFSPLCWALPSNPAFNAKDAQGRQVLLEAAHLQKVIYSKTGDDYISYLKTSELKGLVGMNDAMVEEYTSKFISMDVKSWKQFFAKFVSQGGNV